jgi:ABC-type dipeptide/oligopeptide/nickel transport system permease subunit
MRRAAVILLGIIFVTLLAANFLAPHSYQTQYREAASAQPSRQHLLGTDALGRDRFSRLLYGGRISMLLAPAAALIAVAIALLVGLAAGCLGGWRERAAMGVADLVLSLPWLFLLLAARAMLPLNVAPAASIAITFALLGLLGWAGPSRILLAAVKRQLQSDFVLLARAGGCGRWRVALVHILPNLKPVALAQFWIAAPAFLLSEANLGLLGLGVAEPAPSWGSLLRELESFSDVTRNPWMLTPLVVLVVVVSCFQLAVSADKYDV